jgi:hypothetical protein
MLVIPCQAQNLQESHQENSNLIPASFQFDATTNTNIKSNLGNGNGSSNNQLKVISESTSNEVATTKPNLRIPISSRIFAAPSMKQ